MWMTKYDLSMTIHIQAMHEALSTRCKATSPPGLVLVVGAGFGYVALYAAAM